jgi:hypothetical protein
MLRRLALLGALSIVIVACSSASSEPLPEEEDVGVAAAELTTADAVARAEQWVAVKLHYCQAPNGARDYDAACSTYCNRTANPKWDPYRSDCSGFVSWAWNLPAPGRITTQFAPFQKDITHVIMASDLQAGDAINNAEHIMIFKEWITPNKKAIFLEEPGCSSTKPYARETTSDVTISGSSIHVVFNGMDFTAIRYGALTPPPATPPATPTAPAPGATEAPPPAPAPAAPEPAPAAPEDPSPHAPPGLADTSGCAVAVGTRSPSSSPLGAGSFAAITAIALATAFARRRRSS